MYLYFTENCKSTRQIFFKKINIIEEFKKILIVRRDSSYQVVGTTNSLSLVFIVRLKHIGAISESEGALLKQWSTGIGTEA